MKINFTLIALVIWLCTQTLYAYDNVFDLLDKSNQPSELISPENFIPPAHSTSRAGYITVLNKLTAKTYKIHLSEGKNKVFDNLGLLMSNCLKIHDLYTPYDLILLNVTEYKVDEDNSALFSGWLISGYPALAYIEHPIYEILALGCQ